MTGLEGLLRCPKCRSGLSLDGGAVCNQQHRFAIDDGVPVLTDDTHSQAAAAQHHHQRSHYDREFASYRTYSLDHWQRVYVQRLAPLWHAAPGGPYLDVGAGGSAYTVIEAARQGIAAVACDLSSEGMRAGREFARREGVADRTFFVVCEAERLPFSDASFATVASIAVLEHLPDDSAAIAELARVTRPGGRVFVTVPNALDRLPRPLRPLYRWHDRRVGHLRHYSAAGLTELFATTGLRHLETIYSAHWIKVWQLMLHLGARRLGLADARLWWWLEEFDRRAAGRDTGMHVSLVFARMG